METLFDQYKELNINGSLICLEQVEDIYSYFCYPTNAKAIGFEAEQREQREAMERSLTRDEERIEVLDKMVMRLYEDMIAGRISEQNFSTMLEKTQTEQAELKAKVSEGRKRLSDEVQLANDAKQWVEAIQEYANITELDAATLNRLIKEIVVHEKSDLLSQLQR